MSKNSWKSRLGSVCRLGSIRKSIATGVCCGALLVTGILPAGATYIRHAETVTSSVGEAVSVNNLNNQSGLTSNYVNGVTDFDVYAPNSVLHEYPWENEWFAPLGTTTGSLVFDLGDVFTIDRFAVWNEDSGGTASLEAYGSLDGVTWSALLGTYIPNNNSLNTAYFADVFDLNTVSRYLRFDLTATDPTDQGYDPTLAIGEVAFSVAEPVPEPATMLLFGVGLGVFGFFRGKMKP